MTDILEKIISSVRSAGEIYKSAGDVLGIEQKGSSVNLVTSYDKEIQRFLESELKKIIPECRVIGEEGDGEKSVGDGYCFIIDPIDGTTNFIKGFKHSAICVGLAKDGELIKGVVYNPDADEMFYAEKGSGAFLNGRKIQVSDCDLAHSLVLFGTCPYERELAKETFELTERIFDKSIEVRRSGCAALDICYVACGRADMYYELILRPWDWAGATVILREAGGICSQADGTGVSLNEVKSYLCANPKNIGEFYEIYKS